MDPEFWWRERGPFLRLGGPIEFPTDEQWDLIEAWPGGDKVVYFIQSPYSPLIKIGCSNDPWRRADQFGRGFEVLAIEAGGRMRERQLHREFDEIRADDLSVLHDLEYWLGGTEWFRPEPMLLDYIGPASEERS